MSHPYSEDVQRFDLHEQWQDTRKEAYLYEKRPDGKVRCGLCPRRCIIAENQVGFCKVRKNIGGTLYAQSYGKATHQTIERVETEAVFHYMPGSKILSLGNFGCNLDCLYCQNWLFSQFQYTSPEHIYNYSSDDVIQTALKNEVPILSWTYNDPAVWFEFVVDTAREARRAGLKNLFKSAFFLTPEAVQELIKVIDVFAISIKAMDEDYYRKFTKGWLRPVLDNAIAVHKSGVHYEISNLVVSGLTNNEENYDKMIDFVLSDLNAETPLHFTRFHPDYKYTEQPKTPIEDVIQACRRARARGLKYLYVGNAFAGEDMNTHCPGCRQLLIERFGLSTYVKESLTDNGCCANCGFQTNVKPGNACKKNPEATAA